jgi:phage baseplate assembly protein W
MEINLVQPQKIDFAPSNLIVEVAQNIYNLLSTVKYSVPLDRNFGLSIKEIDQPINLVQAKLRAEIMEAIARYEPRFVLESIAFKTNTSEGALYPVIRGGIKDEYRTR